MKIQYPETLDQGFDYVRDDAPDRLDRLRPHRAEAGPAASVRGRRAPTRTLTRYEPVPHERIDRFEAAGQTDLVASFAKLHPFKIILRRLPDGIGPVFRGPQRLPLRFD